MTRIKVYDTYTEITNGLFVGDMVKVTNGPFSNMYGKIKTLDIENMKVEIALDLFGQETLVELGLNEVEKS